MYLTKEDQIKIIIKKNFYRDDHYLESIFELIKEPK